MIEKTHGIDYRPVERRVMRSYVPARLIWWLTPEEATSYRTGEMSLREVLRRIEREMKDCPSSVTSADKLQLDRLADLLKDVTPNVEVTGAAKEAK